MKKLSYIIVLLVLVILLSTVLVMSVLAQSIEAALTVPARQSTLPANPSFHAVATSHTGVTSVTTPAATIATATPSVTMNTILAEDTFQRADQLFWGTASDGQVWGGDAMGNNVFSITSQVGEIVHGQGAFNATLGPIVANAEIRFTGSLNQFQQSNLGAVLRWTDPNNWYKAYIDGTHLVILKKLAAMSTLLGTIPFKASAGVMYTLRFRVMGTTLSAKAWQADQTEPANWMVTITDNSLQSGYGGLRILMENNTVAKITAFQETTVMLTA